MRRFERIYDVVEPVEDHKAGGYHPVHLGNLFNERDNRLQRDVTLKILKATTSEKSKELSVLTQLSQLGIPHPGKEHVLSLLGHFEHKGPNGLHLCLVFPPMMSDGEAMTYRKKARNVMFVRNISTQIIIGLEFLHEMNIIHSDLHPANILLNTNQAKFQNLLTPPEFSPRPYGMLDTADTSSLMVKIGDLGGAFQSNDKNSRPVTPLGMKAPELLDGRSLDNKIDIWALGCLIFQLATNEPLFPVMAFGCTTEECRAILKDLIAQIIGNGYDGFAVHVGERLRSDFDAETTGLFASFLWSMLQRDPQSRSSASELLRHPFMHR
ncbi:hypothetical protein N7517_009244 [Penicillium concentricum]|uniref:non-specific serine/threonine protein kinase n=1 Tax=Penicillium concentricum TaxID=293559 RepID=A0A9W9UWF1_9EURO|nr:uncharacterized protein N7517_009244 [Penicillium concentricum]KAJ5360053.1 hypothetical protein N7517_009244 [Penicillium concentricum]